MISMVTHSLAGVSMASVSMAGKENKDDIVFYDRLIGDGKAYIDTGIKVDATSSYEVVFRNIALNKSIVSASGINRFFGVFGHTNNNNYIMYGNVTTKQTLYFARKKDADYKVLITPTNVVVYNSDGSIFKDTSINREVAQISNLGDIRLLTGGELKTFIISNGNTITFDPRPCIYQGEAGMYDVVNKVFYGNANTEGSFSVAND